MGDKHGKFGIAKIETNKRGDVRVFTLDRPIHSHPGQYVFVWEPGVAERPFSLMDGEPVMRLLVKNRGKLTENLFGKKEGDPLFVRGPYGTCFDDHFHSDPGSKIYLVSGGYGIAPIHDYAKMLSSILSGKDIKALLGFRSRDDILLTGAFKEHCKEVLVTTDDGSYGSKGMVTDMLDLEPPLEKDQVYACGPEGMLREVARISEKYGVSDDNIILSMERRFKCGEGVCGSCEINGHSVCREGPVISYRTLKEWGGFPDYKRDKSGKKVPWDAPG